MARSPFTWGIDIGKCGLKALRCRMSPTEPRKLVAEAFDYIEYPMILSQPEADAPELVRAALEEFTSRNTLKGDRVALSVPGQLGLSKFIKLPPVEAKKIPDIVRYEARQQIPFPLEQVIWDWQRLAGGMEEGGFVLDAEVALFAMKREQVTKALAPLQAAGIEIDLLQLSPIALANMAIFDQQLAADAAADPDKPPPSLVLVSIGVDTTDLVVTNGLKLWQRSMPIGGNTFTKALVSEMKLTFAKAEHLKRNAVRAEDPKAVFRAMRPVFNEFAADLQRSLNYFSGSDRSATIGKVLLMGNAAKLRGLSDFVASQLQLDVQRLEKYQALEGPAVLGAPAFRENRLAFGTAYGLALQAAGAGAMRTNLLPRQLLRDRIIAEKKPWAVGALTGLLVAGLLNFAGLFFAWKTYGDTKFKPAFAAADTVQSRSQQATAAVEQSRQKWEALVAEQKYLAHVHDHRFQTLDMLRAVQTLLPHDEPGKVPKNPADRREIHVDSLDCQYFPELAVWFASVKRKWVETHEVGSGAAAAKPPAGEQAAAPPAEPGAEASAEAGKPAAPTEPKGPGWVIQLVGHHFHNEDRHKPDEDEQFVRSTLVKSLVGEGEKVLISAGPLAGTRVPVADLGFGWPVIVESSPVQTVRIPVPKPGSSAVGPDGEAIELKRYNFTLQFCWQPRVPGAPQPAPGPAAEPAAP